MEINYIEFDDEDDPKSIVNNKSEIRMTIGPRGMVLLLPNAKMLSGEDQDIFEQILKLAYYQGKQVGKEL